MMDKVILPGGWSWDEPVVSMVKVSSRGLVGSDLKDLIKRAGHQFADKVKHMTFEPGDVPIHLIGLGATEFYGPNRNGDGFREKTGCAKHPTFVKYARWYHNHANKDPLKSFGFVKDSAYHPTMHRVELIVCLNGTKEAADRNKGFVAEKDLADLEAGRDIPVSMACKVAYDVCSGCGNKARSRDEYCTDKTCSYGGLRDNITKVANDGHILHADNPDPTYFDMSRVWRNADRIAHVLGRIKAASASGEGIGGAALAEMMEVTAPWHLFADHEHAGVKLAHRLAAIEAQLSKEAAGRWSLAFAPEVQPQAAWNSHGCKSLLPVLVALAAEKVAMPLKGFLSLACGDDVAGGAYEAVAARLPGVYSRMVEDGSILKAAACNPFVVGDEYAPAWLRGWAREKAAAFSLDESRVEKRIQLAALRRGGALTESRSLPTIKSAGDAEGLARAYALYKLGMLQSLEGSPDFQLTASLAVLQNYSI